MKEIKTLSDIKESKLLGKSNFDSVINMSMQVLSENPKLVDERDMDIGDTPISPMCLDGDLTPIIFSQEVMDAYKMYVEIINNPETAKEYSFVLLGKLSIFNGEKCYIVDKIVDCSVKDSDLSSRVTKKDADKINDTIQNALKDGYNFISIGHTHPNVPEEERTTTVASYLPSEVIDSEYIREPGLNLSLQDIISYEYLYEYFLNNSNIRTAQTVIMFNGEIAMVSKVEENLSKMECLISLNGEEIYVSSKDDFDKNKSQTL